MKKLITILAIVVIGFTANAQTFFYPHQGRVSDSIIKSQTLYTPLTLNYPTTQTVSITFAVDSVSGTPTGTAYIQQSNDNVHFATVGSPIVWTEPHSTWKITSTVPGKSDTCVTVNINPWLGQYLRLKIVSTSTTQHSNYYFAVKAANTY